MRFAALTSGQVRQGWKQLCGKPRQYVPALLFSLITPRSCTEMVAIYIEARGGFGTGGVWMWVLMVLNVRGMSMHFVSPKID